MLTLCFDRYCKISRIITFFLKYSLLSIWDTDISVTFYLETISSWLPLLVPPYLPTAEHWSDPGLNLWTSFLLHLDSLSGYLI